jgi:hypothetical protein
MFEKENKIISKLAIAPEAELAQQAADQAANAAELQYIGTPEYPPAIGDIDVENAIIHGQIRPNFDVVKAISSLLNN